MKLWRIAFAMFAAFSLASCSSDNEEGGLPLTDEETVPEEAALANLTADAQQADKVYLGSGYDVTGAYLSNSSLRENVIDLSKCKDNQLQKAALYSGTGRMPGDAGNAKGFLKGLCESLDFKNVGEPGDVYFAGTFTDNPLFKDASEHGNAYSFLMYMDSYSVYNHHLNLGLYPSDAELERVLTDEFKKALAEESAEDIVERFGTHVLMNAQLGLNILSIYRSGLEANTSDTGRFTESMFRRMREVYSPIFWSKPERNATKGGAISVQFHGGSTQQLSAALGHFPLLVEESSAAVANWWNESCESQANLSLTLLQGDDLWPIYKLIPGEEKRAEVERAVKAYIHSHQLK